MVTMVEPLAVSSIDVAAHHPAQPDSSGWASPVILALLCGGVALLVVFLLAERRLGERALVPSEVLRNRVFAACCAVVLLMSAIFFAALLYLPQYMEVVLHYSAIRSGAGLLPMMAVFFSTALWVDAALALAGFVASVSFVRGLRRSPARQAVAHSHHRVRA
jgi:hypothetical protein